MWISKNNKMKNLFVVKGLGVIVTDFLNKKAPISPATKIAKLLFVAADTADVELPNLGLTPSPDSSKNFKEDFSDTIFLGKI